MEHLIKIVQGFLLDLLIIRMVKLILTFMELAEVNQQIILTSMDLLEDPHQMLLLEVKKQQETLWIYSFLHHQPEH